MGSRQAAPFVVGVARSGTTLLRMMLDSHPALAIPPETHFASSVIDAFGSDEDGTQMAIRAMVDSPRWSDFGISADDFQRTVAGLPEIAPGPILRTFYEIYAARLGKARWGDKTPPYLDRMTSIQRVLPEAHFIHMIRDGRDVALSVIPLWFGPDDLAEAALHWSSRIEAARLQAAELPAYLELRYEDLVHDPASTLQVVCDFLELPWDDAMLDYHRHADERLAELGRDVRWHDGRTIPASARTAIHQLATQPPRSNRTERWRTEMPTVDRDTFERVAGGMLGQLGYELSSSAM